MKILRAPTRSMAALVADDGLGEPMKEVGTSRATRRPTTDAALKALYANQRDATSWDSTEEGHDEAQPPGSEDRMIEHEEGL